MMSTLPKSVVVGGRRYPTWALSSEARQQLINLKQVDAHIAELKDRLAYYLAARKQCQDSLSRSLPTSQTSQVQRYYWQMAPAEWAHQPWSPESAQLLMRNFGASEHYREGDCLLIYVKGYGVCGWGEVRLDRHSTKRLLVWRCRVTALADAISAKVLREYALRHPTRASQRLPADANIEPLLSALNARIGVDAV